MSHLVRTNGCQQPLVMLLCRFFCKQRQEAFNKRREPRGLDAIGVDSLSEIVEKRSVISGGMLHTYSGLRSKIYQESRYALPLRSYLRQGTAFCTTSSPWTGCPRENTCGAGKRERERERAHYLSGSRQVFNHGKANLQTAKTHHTSQPAPSLRVPLLVHMVSIQFAKPDFPPSSTLITSSLHASTTSILVAFHFAPLFTSSRPFSDQSSHPALPPPA